MAKGIDRAVPFTSNGQLSTLVKNGYSFIGRYLSRSSWKALTAKEAKLISDAGLYVVTVYQNANNTPDYFTTQRGTSDGADAVARAKAAGQPKNTPIYFAVDFDASASNVSLARVYAYFASVQKALAGSGYKVGVYGSYGTCNSVMKKLGITYAWQTVAWSKGKVIDNVNLYQYKIDTPLPESKAFGNVDLLTSNGNGGGWKVAK